MPGSIIKALHVLLYTFTDEKPWFRDVKEIAQGHTAGQWSS